MTNALRALPISWPVIFLALLMPALAAAQDAAYKNDEAARSARSFEAYLLESWAAKGHDARGWQDKADAALKAGDPRAATSYYASAAKLQPGNSVYWLGLARAYLAIPTDKYSEQRDFRSNAGATAYLAYLRAKTNAMKGAALAVLGQSLAARSLWRPAINAYAASLKFADTLATRANYEKLRAEHGFRMLDYSVDSDTASPRACIQFSERLAKGVDFNKYISVNGGDPVGLKVEARQICIEELLHGRRYEIRLRQGLPSAIGESLLKPVELTIYVRDRQPSARFTGRNYVLPRTGQQGLPLVTVNAKEVRLKLYRIGDRALARQILEGDFGQQLSGYDASQIKDRHGELLWQGEMPVKMVLNEEVTTAFPVDEVKPGLKPGLYVLTAQPKGGKNGEWQSQATQWFVVSDLGLTAMSGRGGIDGFVRSLASAAPLAGVELRLIARNNEVLGTAKTDDEGHVHFPAGLARGEGGLAPALLIARTSGGDYGFLDLSRQAFDLTDRGVGGRVAPGPLDAMVYAERGVYRPGEEVHLTALLRNDKAEASAGVPLTLIIHRPDGVEDRRVLLPDQGNGGHSFSFALLPSAMAGTWRVEAHVDPKAPAIGETAFLVADYEPERLEMTLDAPKQPVPAGAVAAISLKGRYLYGAPAAGLGLEGSVALSPKRQLAAYPGYLFGLADDQAGTVRETLSGLPRTDAKGEARLSVSLPAAPETTRPLQGEVTVRLREPGGRALADTATFPVAGSGPVLAVKPLFDGDNVPEGGIAKLNVIALGPDQKPLAMAGLKWELVRLETRFQWYSRNGSWNYEPVSYSRRVADGTVSVSAGAPGQIAVPVAYGRYRLDITSTEANGPAASMLFYGGWYVAEGSDTPDLLDIALDKASYAPGEALKVRITPRMAGRALVAIVSDRLLAMKEIDVPADGTTVSFTTGADWGPGAYVTAMLYRPLDVATRRMPGRALGVKWIPLDISARKLGIALGAPEKMRPRTTLRLPVKLSGLGTGETAHVVVAAVDKGILNLTNYQPPEPDSYYFGQRRLGTEIRDLYGRLIDGMQGTRGVIRTGGGAMAGGLQMQGRPRNIKPVALYSGIVATDGEGRAEIAFDIPAFDGTLRVMAIAWSANKLGHAVSDVIVRDPVVMLGTPPRFLNLGDRSQIYLSLDNVEGPAGAYELTAQAQGGLVFAKASTADAPDKGGAPDAKAGAGEDDAAKTKAPDSDAADAPADKADKTGETLTPRKFNLAKGARLGLALPIKAASLGQGSISVSLNGPGDLSISREFDIPVMPAAPHVTRRTVQTLAANTGSVTITPDLASDLIPQTVKISVDVGPTAALDIPGLLLALDRYPYGCAEQLTSRALPLLYLGEMADTAGLAGDDGAKKRVQKAIDRLAALQDSGGSFGLWSPGGSDVWLSAYVTDFLLRAREQGYKIRSEMLVPALDRLKNTVSYASDFHNGGDGLAYALYVLARASRAVVGDLRYYADTKLNDFATPLAQAQIGAALAMYGDKERAQRAFRAALARLEKPQPAELPFNRADYGSELRDGAGTLSLIAESGDLPGAIPALMRRVQGWREQQGVTSTQEDAWLLLAARALIGTSADTKLIVNGTEQQGAVRQVLKLADLAEAPFSVRNATAQPMPVSVVVSGASAAPQPAASAGLRIERKVYTPDGKPASLDKVRQNDRFVVVVKIAEDQARLGQLIVEDRLPAGFQIENPRLVKGNDLSAFSWLKTDAAPVYTAFHDDAMLVAFSLAAPKARKRPAELSLAYIVRAVSPGRYIQPGAKVEDMYRPGRYARTEPGVAQIVAAE